MRPETGPNNPTSNLFWQWLQNQPFWVYLFFIFLLWVIDAWLRFQSSPSYSPLLSSASTTASQWTNPHWPSKINANIIEDNMKWEKMYQVEEAKSCKVSSCIELIHEGIPFTHFHPSMLWWRTNTRIWTLPIDWWYCRQQQWPLLFQGQWPTMLLSQNSHISFLFLYRMYYY